MSRRVSLEKARVIYFSRVSHKILGGRDTKLILGGHGTKLILGRHSTKLILGRHGTKLILGGRGTKLICLFCCSYRVILREMWFKVHLSGVKF